MTSRANLIARTVISQFDKLPSKRKPCVRDNGLNEWVPLSGIVAERNGVLTCLALATGMKCLPASKLTEAKGVAIHDWHAEILAIRTFNRFLLDECQTLVEMKEDVKLHMYCSEAPCGDASMELIMAAQADASPWQLPTPPKPVSANTPTDLEADSTAQLPGRAYFSQLGIVRRKPARGDAPPTLSKSCSDKISLKQCTSLLSSLASLFVDPANAYIDTLVLPESQYSAAACERAFSPAGRMKPVAGKQWPGGYAFRPFKVEATSVEFAFSKRAVQARSEAISASNLAATWSASGFEESILGGVLQGRKQFDVRGASKSSRRQMWMKSKQLFEGLSAAAPIPASDSNAENVPDTDRHRALQEYLSSASSYQDIKDGRLLADRRHVKAQTRELALKGWIQNEGDADFGIA
ncbi:hypothetical protein MKX07_008262 [Trichoderma sp. CBMAI-0711]|nr:hypothetical protein MKX07_008262 [Trichoderma sp. CBMAI-0711]